MSENGSVMTDAPPIRERLAEASPEHFLSIALTVLSVRAARWTTLLMSFVLFGAACWWPDWRRLAAAGGFALVISVPIWFKKER